jgi:CHAT domain-containing protein/tetratricopeptide (TPR) repeat protein
LLALSSTPAFIASAAVETPPAAEADAGEWRRLNARMIEAFSRGALAEAAQPAQSALAIAEKTFGREARETLTSAYNLGSIYSGLGRYEDAKVLYLRALEGRERTLGRANPDTLAVANNLGMLYFTVGKYSEAEPLILRAAHAEESNPEISGYVRNLANLYKYQGRYSEAEPLYLRALALSERAFGQDHLKTIASVSDLAMYYEAQERYALAEPLITRAWKASERLLGTDHPTTLALINNAATLYESEQRYGDAEPLLLHVLAMRDRTAGPDSADTLISVNNLGGLYFAEGKYVEAEPLFSRALELSQRIFGPNHPKTAAAMFNLGEAYAFQGRYRDADRLLARALGADQATLGPDHPATIDAADGLTIARLMAAGPLGDALAPARLAVAGIRARRLAVPDSLQGEAQQTHEDRAHGNSFSLLGDAAWDAGEKGQAKREALVAEVFASLQDATVGTTSRAVARMAARHFAAQLQPELGDLIGRRELLEAAWSKNNISYTALLTASTHPAAELERLQSERGRLESDMKSVDSRLHEKFPRYFAMVRPDAVALQTAQQMLAPNEAILLLVPAAFGTHVIAVSRDAIQWQRSAWTDTKVNEAVRRLLWDVGASVDISPAQSMEWQLQAGPGPSYDRKTAYKLYRELVAPVAATLAGKRHLFIVAGKSLSSLPFSILVTEEPKGSDSDPSALRATSWFADAHALIQIPSIQSLQFLRLYTRGQEAPADSTGFIGFGDPLLEGKPTPRSRGRGQPAAIEFSRLNWSPSRSGSGVVERGQLAQLPRLTGTAEELEQMRAALGAGRNGLFLEARATETNLKALDLSRVRILALATHGLMAGELKGVAEAGLVLTPPKIANEQDDGFLTTSEIAALRLNADWVILSACNTAAGDGSQGSPGLAGLTRAFFFAGARNLLASHWPVRDDVAGRLTVRTITIERSDKGFSRAEALQRAMREIRNDVSHDKKGDTWAHPNAWAPFVLVGDGAN